QAGPKTDLTSKDPLPPPDVVPAPEFEADLAIDADRREAHRLVERDASRIWQRDAGKCHVYVALLELWQQFDVERVANTASLRLGRDVNRGVGGVAIGGTLAMRACVDIAADFSSNDSDKPGMRLQGRRDPPGYLVDRRRHVLE